MNLRKKVLIGVILLILTASCTSLVSGYHESAVPIVRCLSSGFDDLPQRFNSQCKSPLFPHPTYEPEDIDLKDAAFHSPHGRYHWGWWYFEGIFDNGYSAVLAIFTCSKGDRGFGLLGLHIYNDTKLEFCKRKIFFLKDFEASEEFPFVKVSGKQIMKLDREIYNDTGEWVYNVSMEIDNYGANLQFAGTTEGWKGEILGGWYGPTLPKATVKGTLTLNGETINASGLGYQEHAWELTFPIWEWGWYWGKIVGDNFTLYWAKMMQTRWREQQRIAILTQDQDGYIAINPENIKFKATEYTIYKRRIIPTKFVINVTDPDNSIYVNATMETMDIHLFVLGPIHYHRYHVNVNGQISYGSSTEIIKDQIQTVELMRFR